MPAGRRAVRSPGVAVHRARQLEVDRLGGLPVTELPQSLTDSCSLALGVGGRPREVELARAAVIEALRERQVRPVELRTMLSARPTLPGRQELDRLIGLVAGGCQSELEIWGVEEVLRGSGMPTFVQQHPVALPFATVHLDAAVPELKLAVELDGAAFHGSRTARERDIRRDAALTAEGWVVLRFSYRRLTREPEACRRDILRACAARRALLAAR